MTPGWFGASGRMARMAWEFPQRKVMVAGGVLTLAGIASYDVVTYFFLPQIFSLTAGTILVAGLAALLAGGLHAAWRASANTLATIGLVLGFMYVIATVSPTMFAPPSVQGGEPELFRRTPLILAFAGALLLIGAGCRYMFDRAHNRR